MVKFGDWAITEDLSVKIVDRLDKLSPKIILECGSGVSTQVIGEWTESAGSTLFALEHNKRYFEETRSLCAEFESVKILFAPIKQGFYEAELPLNIDFVLIDGPPSNIGREKTLPKLWDNLSEGAEIWLDDANRDHEQRCLKLWKDKYPINIELDTAEKGLAIITRK